MEQELQLQNKNLSKEQQELLQKENTVNKIDDELQKARSLYEDLMKKYNKETSK